MDIGAGVVYVMLFVLMIYNLRRNYHLTKLRSKAKIRQPEKLSKQEQGTLKGYTADKKKWSILGQIFFLTSLFMAFKGTLAQLAFFMDLYTVAMIVVSNRDIDIIKLLRQPSQSN
ncbi:hypothetical protein LFYK43_09580 [Ligilactobacillus salitolerans]|uniref:Uncharacterized protein n=1 Tax=Ligilactobacillus salitolerans TaxID=1808352 RepID=A0A401ISI9_9LACO|nr:hypothetical protein [Ligilactobacillus salitolerans]GBG94499.1 hypothetical protein LFYK43_09580 [Ligilactobacillus salitolerans]